MNPAFEASTGYKSKVAIGETPRILKSGKMPEHIYEGLWENLHQGLPWRGELLNHRANKEEFWALTSIAPITGDDQQITHYVCIMEDITRHKQQEQQLAFQAKYDAVTGLPNRMVAMQRLTNSIRLAKNVAPMCWLYLSIWTTLNALMTALVTVPVTVSWAAWLNF
ncbi:PAS domain S-box protein [Aliamphritea spongicola]|nr:PAS domain S-box protein [Aliamphritea spongicola]